MKCCECGPWGRVHNASFSSWPTNRPNKLERLSLGRLCRLIVRLQLIGPIHKMKMKCCECGSWCGIHNVSFSSWLTNGLNRLVFYYIRLERRARYKHSRLLGLLISYEDYKVFWIQPLVLIVSSMVFVFSLPEGLQNAFGSWSFLEFKS